MRPQRGCPPGRGNHGGSWSSFLGVVGGQISPHERERRTAFLPLGKANGRKAILLSLHLDWTGFLLSDFPSILRPDTHSSQGSEKFSKEKLPLPVAAHDA